MWNQSVFSTDGFQANDTIELPVSSYPKGQSFRVRSWKVGTSRRWLGRAAERWPPSGGVSGDPRAAELSNPCAAQKGWSPLSALQPFGVWSRSHRASEALPPRPPPHQAPPSPRLGSGRTLAGRRRGRLADPGSLAAAAERSRHSRGTAASSSCGLGGDVGGKRLPTRRFQALGQMPFLFRRLRPRPPPANPDGRPASLQCLSAGLRRGGGSGAGPEAQSPPLRPAPSVGLAPEGGSGEGRWGPHPQSLPFLRPAQTRSPGAVPALAPSSPPRQTRPAEAKPLEKSPALRGLPPDPRPRAAANCCPLLRMRHGERGACVLNGT